LRDSAGVEASAGVADPRDQLALDKAVHVLVRRRVESRRAWTERRCGIARARHDRADIGLG
jgi:hypothetical protein